ncbi:aquaporin-1 [Obelidium mucronatum]|nr:aquaporin-1 [Obelidium mucronatum]
MSKERSQFVKLGLQSATEALGMFIFLFLSLGGVQSALKTNSAAELAANPTLAFIEISLCFGFGLATAIFFSYRISGGALNPAVNFGLFVAGVMDPLTLGAYTIAQMIGATAACGAVDAIFPGDFKGANQVFPGTTITQAFFLELILTMGLVLTVLFLAVEKSKITFYAPMMIGVYVFIAHLLAIPYTNTSINPARSFGASVVAGVWNDHWLFWIAPLVGGGVAGAIYRGYKLIEYESLNPGQDADHV